MSTFRYPGVKPFSASEKQIFFGRDRDIADLSEMILLEKLVVLFGKSGYGKSSLLNAGVLPLFKQWQKEGPDGDSPVYTPVSIRFGLYIEGQSSSLLDQTRARLAEAAKENPEGAFLNPGTSLWHAFKSRQGGANRHFLLVFDQFEEFFSYPLEQRLQFNEELSELLFTTLPQAVRNRLDEFKEEERRFLARRLDMKAVFAIRSDRMSDLDQLKDRLPGILYKRYELKGLQKQQAREAVEKPASLPNEADRFSSPTFTYSPKALEIILNELSSTNKAQPGSIEAFQLQILCQYIENAVIGGRIKDRDGNGTPDVFPEDLPDISNIYGAYYHSQLNQLEPEEREAARDLIEYGLLFDDEQKREARRLSMDGDALVQRFKKQGADHDLLKKLENTFLLRREANTLGGFSYEISHDTLLEPVLKAKRKREAEIERQKSEERAQQAEALAREEAERRTAAEKLQREAEQGRKRANWFSLISAALFVVSLVVTLFAVQQRNKAKASELDAQQKQRDAEEALNRFLSEKRAKTLLQVNALNDRAEYILRFGGCPLDLVETIDSLLAEYPDQKPIADTLHTRIKNANCE